jgi:hypothetical protein
MNGSTEQNTERTAEYWRFFYHHKVVGSMGGIGHILKEKVFYDGNDTEAAVAAFWKAAREGAVIVRHYVNGDVVTYSEQR